MIRIGVGLCVLGMVLMFASDARLVGAAPVAPCDNKCRVRKTMMFRDQLGGGANNTWFTTYKDGICHYCQGGTNLCKPVDGDKNTNVTCVVPPGMVGTNRLWVVTSTNVCPFPPLVSLSVEAEVKPKGDGDGDQCDPSDCPDPPNPNPQPGGG